ncbi:MAG: phage tail assembly chaperone [Sphingomonadales bacterium]|nr:phage tail assembly chaperone [Sphingomonadales bacterium]MDE2568771.1 phage tail assembly chaperone [Sphingomonadales bacterium]
MSRRFGEGAVRLSGQAALLLGWSPAQFWAATPQELESVLAAHNPPGGEGVDRTTLKRMMEREDNGSTR